MTSPPPLFFVTPSNPQKPKQEKKKSVPRERIYTKRTCIPYIRQEFSSQLTAPSTQPSLAPSQLGDSRTSLGFHRPPPPSQKYRQAFNPTITCG